MAGKCNAGIRKRIAALTLLGLYRKCLCAYAAGIEIRTSDTANSERHPGLPVGPVVIWGYSFPFELAFPVLASDLDSREIVFYGLDSFTHAPFSAANAEQNAGRGMIQRLGSAEGATIIAHDYFLNELGIYCRERLNGRLHGVSKKNRLRC